MTLRSVSQRLSRSSATVGYALLVAPAIAAILFVQDFATPFPLTDEWFFVRAILTLQDADCHSLAGIAHALTSLPTKFGEHCVTVPFLFYWPIAEWTHFDSRWAICLTLAAFAVQAALFHRVLGRSPWWTLPIVLILYCPSHFMEFLWGWQFTLAFSIAFPLCGLVVLDRVPLAGGWRAQLGHIAAAIGLILLGVGSSAGGFLGFPSAMLLLALKPMPRAARIGWIVLIGLIAGAVFAAVMHAPEGPSSAVTTAILFVATAVGGTIWGSPVGSFEFDLDARSATGLVLAAALALVVLRGWRIGVLSRLALPLAMSAFGWLCIATIAMSRPYLGNWHLQYALPATCGVYAAAQVLWRIDRTAWSGVPCFGSLALLVCCLPAYGHGFRVDGPEYRQYAQNIALAVKRNLMHPDAPKPYPDQGPWDMNAELLLFLSANGHAVFTDPPPPSVRRPLPWTARVFVDGAESHVPVRVVGGCGPVSKLTVLAPDTASAKAVVAWIGDTRLILRRIAPRHAPAGCGAGPGSVCFQGLVVPHLLEDGPHAVEFALLR